MNATDFSNLYDGDNTSVPGFVQTEDHDQSIQSISDTASTMQVISPDKKQFKSQADLELVQGSQFYNKYDRWGKYELAVKVYKFATHTSNWL